MTNVRNGIVVITGAGRGLGQALSVEFARRGRVVAGIGRTDEGLVETETLVRNLGGAFHVIRADIAYPASIHIAFEKIRQIGPIGILVNNAAIHPKRDFLDENTESFMKTVAVNLGGTVGCTRAALSEMIEHGSGRILNVSSFADVSPAPLCSAYSVSKGAARIFTRSIIADLSDRFPGIVINDWVPGILATQMGQTSGLAPTVAATWGAELALWYDRSLNGTLWKGDREILPHRSLKRRIVDLTLLRGVPTPRRLGSGS